jgi:hypothetical protein
MMPSVLNVPAACILIGFALLFVAPAPAYSQAAFRLVGTIEGGQGFTGAVLDDDSGSQTFYHIREPLPDGSQIVRIQSDKVTIRKNDGSSYELFLVQSTKPGPAVPGRSAVSSAPAAAPATGPVPGPRGQQHADMSAPPAGTPDPGPGVGNAGSDDGNGRVKKRRARRTPRRRAAVED